MNTFSADEQQLKNIKRFKRLKKSCLVYWLSILALILIVIFGVQKVPEFLPVAVLLFFIANKFYYLYFLGHLAAAANSHPIFWVILVLFADFIGVIFSYSRMKTIAMANGWTAVEKEYKKAVAKELERMRSLRKKPNDQIRVEPHV